MERRLQERQIPIGLLSKQVVLKVEEAAQHSGRGIRHQVKEPVSQAALVLKNILIRRGDSWQLAAYFAPLSPRKRQG